MLQVAVVDVTFFPGVAESSWLIEPIVEVLDDAVIGRESDGAIRSWSRGAERLYGYAARRLGKDGDVIDVSVRIAAVRDSGGEIVGVSTIEHVLESQDAVGSADIEAYLRSAFEDAPIGIALVSIAPHAPGRFLRVNRALCDLTGYSAVDLEATAVKALLHPDDVEPDRCAMQRLTAGESDGFQLEQRLIHAGRHVVGGMVSVSLVRDRCSRPLYCIRQMQNIEERKRFEGELGYLADHDPLTGLLNRRGFVRDLTHEIAHVRRYGGGGAVLFLDIDDFKHVNDTLGHSVGDELLSDVTRVIHGRLRETDVFARLGGDGFAVLLPRATEADARALAASVMEAVRGAELATLGGGRAVTASIGISSFAAPGKEATADDILIDADLAMYAAKDAGKDRAEVASVANHERMQSRVTWAQRVANALRDEGFELYCQPIVDLRTDTTTQFELLLRLPGERGELILPAQFLYTAERSGSIVEIDRWVLRHAMRLIAEHKAAGRELRLHVNLSGRSVGDPHLPGFIEQHLNSTAIDPATLVLEVTETAAIANMDRARTFATQLTEIGCRLKPRAPRTARVLISAARLRRATVQPKSLYVPAALMNEKAVGVGTGCTKSLMRSGRLHVRSRFQYGHE